MIGLNETTSKTFSDLPPHWSLSVRFDVIAINANKWSTSYLKIYLDSVLQATYTYQNNYFWKICSSADNLILYNKNLTTHTKTSITVSINADTSQDTFIKGILLRNFFLYVDTCDISCATCNGPTNVRTFLFF